jgi:membrane associated rhomboid family serine protease
MEGRPLGYPWLLWLAASWLAWDLFVRSRRGRPPAPVTIALLGANLFLVLMVLVPGQLTAPRYYLAVAFFATLVVVPAVLRELNRRAMAAGRFDLALRLTRLRDLLRPGAGDSREGEMLAALALAQRGRTKEAIDRLESWASRGGPGRLVDAQEQIVAILSLERRFAEAIAYGEALGPAAASRPILCAELIRAYAEIGDLVRAAAMLRRLEDGPAGANPAATDVINQARLFFLAHVGEAEALAYLLAPESGFLPSLPVEVRAYWRGVALMRAGRVDAGRAELLRAQALGRGDQERLRAAVRERIAAGAGEPAPEEVVRYARDVALRARVHRALPGAARRLASTPVTVGLCVVLALVFALVEIGGSSDDSWTLIRAGAQFEPAVMAGDLWRLVSATFLHGGLAHLGLNLYALFVLGRVVEQLYGSVRFLVVYVLSGIVGFAVSALHGHALSVGASGCIMGLLGAVIAVVATRRGHWPEGWRKAVLGRLLFIVALNVGIGVVIPVIDNAAHMGGLCAGLALGVLLVPEGPLGSGTVSRAVVSALATLSLLAVAYGAAGTLAADPARLLTRLPATTSRLGSVLLRHPDYWTVVHQAGSEALVDPLGAVGLLIGDADPRGSERDLAAKLPRDGDVPQELTCRRLGAGPTFCLRYPGSGREAYLPLLDAMVASSRGAP